MVKKYAFNKVCDVVYRSTVNVFNKIVLIETYLFYVYHVFFLNNFIKNTLLNI